MIHTIQFHPLLSYLFYDNHNLVFFYEHLQLVRLIFFCLFHNYLKEPESDYQIKMRHGSDTLYNHKATKHSEIALERLALIPPKGGKESLPPEHLTKSIYSGTWERMDADDISVTITTRFDTPSSGKFTHPYLDRAITVREAARIQSFPDTFKFYGYCKITTDS